MQQELETARLEVKNIGGIDNTSVTLKRGVTVLAGRNATNRTSLLMALRVALGSEKASLKGDADQGRAELTLGDEQYFQNLQREGSSITFDGEPLLDDPILADLFAFLLETNEARRAVARTDELHDIMMRPVDTDTIDSEIRRLQNERNRIDEELDELSTLQDSLPDLEQKRKTLREQVDDKRAELSEVQAEIEETDAELEERRAEKQEVEEKLEELQSLRSAMEDVRYKIETERESADSLRSQRSELETEHEELTETPDNNPNDIESEIESIRDRKTQHETEITDLQEVIQFNEEMLEERSSIGRTTSDEGNITAELLPEQGDVTCWTCGSEVKTDRIKETIDHLRDRLQTKLSKSGDLDDRLDELKIRRRELREEESRRQRLNDRIADIDRELEERTSRVEDLEEREEELITDVEELESRVQALENEDFEGILDLHRTANQVELEIEQIESQRQSVDEEIAEIESRLEEVDELENRRETINLELEDLRTRVEQLERDAVEAFNQHMNEILGILEYDNLERIWIERTEQTVRKGRRKEHRPTFDLHVVRQTDNGATYEDTIDHLSESERKVTGLVFALAGYLVHDVHEELPFILLDSVEASDAQRIVALVDHFQDHADFLVVALLEEDAQALNESSVDVSITSV